MRRQTVAYASAQLKETMKRIFLLLLLLTTPAYAKIQETTWTPDTCDCTVTFEWDDSVPAEQRVHTFKRIDKPEKVHENLSPEEQFETIKEENQRKNKAISDIHREHPEIKPEEIKFSYDKDRKLHLDNIPSDKKVKLNKDLKEKYGESKVEVD